MPEAEPRTEDASESLAGGAPGWYGKLSSLGDFAERRLPPDVVQTVDAWLSRSMSASRARLGDDWLQVYLTAPLLRFAWAPGVIDSAWWFGLMMPSCDKVGRYFPLWIGSRRAQPPQDRLGLDHLDAWFDHLADAATASLADGASIAAFEQALGEAPPWPGPPANSGGERLSSVEPHGLRPWLQGIASEALQARFAGCSIWWRDGPPFAANVIHGLPEATAFAAMLGAG